MKARVIKTGEWLTVNPCDDGFYDVETHNIYEPDELDFSIKFDWDIFRREAAKDFVAAMLSNATPTAEQWATPDIVNASLEIVDELIKQLKEEEQ